MIQALARRRLPLTALLALPVGFNLWVLRAESRVAENLNDGVLHAAMIRTAAKTFRHGRIPLDVWFPFLSTGSANFHQYQSLPHIVTGFFAAVVGGDRAYSWSLYLLLALWPVCVYASMRLLEFEPRAALGAAFVASLVASRPGYGYEWISYTFGGLGVWTQLWGMWLLPLCLGLTWQAVEHRRHVVAAAMVLALTIVSHVLTGYFAALAVGVWIVVGLDGKRPARRAVVGAAVGAAAAAANAWLMIPFLTDKAWLAGGAFTQGFWRDSFGARQVFGWLVTGNLFDRAFMPPRIRFPLITILVFLGVLRCIVRFRTDSRARALLGVFVLSLVMFSGRPTFGFVLNRLPGSSALLLHRYVLAVHMAGILLAGVGAAWLLALLRRAIENIVDQPRAAATDAVLGVLVVVALLPAWTERAHYAAWSRNLISGQVAAQAADAHDRADLIDIAKRRGDGRIYAGLRNNWGADYKVGFVAGYASLLNHDADGLGYTFRVGSMLTDAEPYLDDRNVAELNAFGVRYLLMPRTRMPSVPASVIQVRGKHTLWEIPTSGYVALVDTIEPVTIRDRLHAGAIQTSFLHSKELTKGLYPTVAYLGRPAARPTASASDPPKGAPGVVRPIRYEPTAGVFHVQVTATRTAAVMLKSSYHGRWRVRVDGHEAVKYMVAPGYPAVTVKAGAHDVEFRYMPVSSYPWLFLLGALALAALYVAFEPTGRRRLGQPVHGPSVGRSSGGAGPVASASSGTLSAQQRNLADDPGDRPILLADSRPLHRHEEEQQQEPHVESEVHPASDTQVLGDNRGEVGGQNGHHESAHQDEDDKPVPPG